jgi:hypothetical protein
VDNSDAILRKSAELNALVSQGEGLHQRYQAHLLLHDAAAISGNRDEIEQRRDECHTVLDAFLDNAESVRRVGREIERLCHTSS